MLKSFKSFTFTLPLQKKLKIFDSLKCFTLIKVQCSVKDSDQRIHGYPIDCTKKPHP